MNGRTYKQQDAVLREPTRYVPPATAEKTRIKACSTWQEMKNSLLVKHQLVALDSNLSSLYFIR